METAIAGRFIVVALVLFGLGAVLIVCAGWRRGPAVARRLWQAYIAEFGILAAIIVPARIGIGALLIAVAAICALATWELYSVLER
ncbi:MAG: hypothetical protein J2P17_22930, partial [Mycobacterium sp.]|nr:hypothetical protein [Mycobacterium sp.]